MNREQKPISALGRIVTGKTPSTKNRAFFDGPYPFVTPTDLTSRNYYCRSTETTVSEEARDRHKNQFIPENSVMVTCIGNTIGKSALSASISLTNQQINSIVAYEEYDPRFIYYLMLHNTERIRGIGIGGGAAMPILNKTTFSKIKLSIPPKPVRDSLVEILSVYDDLIENNRRRIQLLEQSARMLYKEWFVHLRFPGHEHVKMKKGVPEGWERCRLSLIAEEIRESVEPRDVSEDTPYIGLEHIPRRSITLSGWGQASEISSAKFAFKKGDILFGKIRPYFHKVGFTLTDGITSIDTVVLRPTSDLLNGYCLLLLSSDLFVALASKTVREGSKMPRADWKFLSSSLFLRPPDPLLEVFESTVSPVLAQLRSLAIANHRLAAARDILLPKLMSGEVEV